MSASNETPRKKKRIIMKNLQKLTNAPRFADSNRPSYVPAPAPKSFDARRSGVKVRTLDVGYFTKCYLNEAGEVTNIPVPVFDKTGKMTGHAQIKGKVDTILDDGRIVVSPFSDEPVYEEIIDGNGNPVKIADDDKKRFAARLMAPCYFRKSDKVGRNHQQDIPRSIGLRDSMVYADDLDNAYEPKKRQSFKMSEQVAA